MRGVLLGATLLIPAHCLQSRGVFVRKAMQDLQVKGHEGKGGPPLTVNGATVSAEYKWSIVMVIGKAACDCACTLKYGMF